MQETDQDTDMVRIPGLYRYWELPQILRMHAAFRIEAAGSHEDGTPLLAVFSSDEAVAAQIVAELWTNPAASADTPTQATG